MPDILDQLKREPFTRFSRRYLGLVARKDLSPGELVLLLAVADKTVSWRKLWLKASYTDLTDLTGMTRKGLVTIIARLIEADLLVRKPIGRSFSYALVPPSLTGAQVLLACAESGVDNPQVMVTSGNSHRIPEVDDQGDLTYSSNKKSLKKGRGLVDETHDPNCGFCFGTGWKVDEDDDGYNSSVARCSCVQEPSL